MSVVVTQIVGRSNDCNLESIYELSSAYSSIENGAFKLGVGTNKYEEVGVVYSRDMRIHQVLSAEVALQLRGVTSDINVFTVQSIHEVFEGTDALNVLELADDSLNLVTFYRRKLFGGLLHGFLPGELLEATIFRARHRNSQALFLQAIERVTRLIANPLLVDFFVDARKDSH